MAVFAGIPVRHLDVFPEPVYALAPPTPILDFDVPKRPDGSMPQARDKVTGRLLWELLIVDTDERARKKSKTVSVKFAADHQPVLPENTSGFPLTPVEFVGLVAVPYIDASNLRIEDGKIKGRPSQMWSFRAEGMVAPGQSSTGKADARKAVA